MNKNENKFLGRIRGIKGQIAYVRCESDILPKLGEILVSDDDKSVMLEAYQYVDKQNLKCLILEDGDLYRNKKIFTTGSPLVIPVGKELLGRAVNMFGYAEDGMEEIKSETYRPVVKHSDIKFSNGKIKQEIAETGIKAIDFFAPITKGAKLGIVGGAGVGKTVLMNELLNNLTKSNKDGVTIFAGIGERTREAHELWHLLKDYGLRNKSIMMLGMINLNAAVRFRTADSATTLVEYFRDEEEKDVLFFVDNIFRLLQAGSELSSVLEEIPSEFGYQPSLQTEIAAFENRLHSNNKNSVTSVQTVYVPEDRLSDPAVTNTLPHMDSVIVLSQDTAQQGRRPAVDLLQTKSKYMEREIVGDKHYEVATRAVEIINRYNNLKRIVSIVGEEELSEEKRLEYRRAEKLINYMTQPFFFTENQTGQKGVVVKRSRVVADVEGILNGKYDEIEVTKFRMKGNLSKLE